MPIVQRVSTPSVRTQVSNQPKARNAPSAAFAGNTLGPAVSGIADDFAKAQLEVDQTTAEDALVQFEREKNSLMFDPESGYFNSKGRVAMDGASVANNSMLELQKKYVESLDNEQSRQLFTKASDVHITRSQQSVLRHAADNKRVYEIAVQSDRQENAIEGGVLHWNNNEEMNFHEELGVDSIHLQSEITGVDPTEKLQTFRSTFALGAIDAAVQAGDVARAEELRDKAVNSKRLEGPDVVRANKLIKLETDKQYTMSETDRIYNSGQSRAKMLEDARKEEDASRRKEIERNLINQLNADKLAHEEQQRETYDALWKEFTNTNSNMRYNDLSQQDIELLSPVQLGNLKEAEKRRMSGADVPDNHITMTRLRALPRTEQAKLQPADYQSELSQRQIKQLESLVNDARKGGGETLRSNARVLESGITTLLGRKPKPKSLSDTVLVNAFGTLVEDEVAALEATKPTGQSVTPQEMTEIVNRMSRSFTEEDAYLGFIDADRSLKDIPPNERHYIPEIGNFLRGQGKSVTPENILQTYQHMVDTGAI